MVLGPGNGTAFKAVTNYDIDLASQIIVGRFNKLSVSSLEKYVNR